MKIFVTGSESFVGKELITQCLKRNISVMGIDKLVPVLPNYEFHEVDIRNPMTRYLIPDSTDAVVHLAALSRDSACRDKMKECFDVNVMGTLNIMRAAKERGAKQFIFASTEWVYDRPKSEYALSKLVSEETLRIECKNGFCNITILRFGIIYGPRKNPSAGVLSAVESIFNAVKNTSEVTVGSKRSARRFVHVSDIGNGIISSLGLPGFNLVNLTGDGLITLGEIVEESEKILGKKVSVVELSPKEPSVRDFSNAYAKKLLSWAPGIDLPAGLRSLL